MIYNSCEVELGKDALVSNYESLRGTTTSAETNVLSGGIGLAILRCKGFANLITMWPSLSTSTTSNIKTKYNVTMPIIAPEADHSQVTSLLASMILGKRKEHNQC